MHVEVPHANLTQQGVNSRFGTVAHLSEVTRMVLVKVDPVMVLATSVSATSRVLPVLSDPGQNVRERASQKPRPSNEQLPAVSVGHMTSQLPGLLLASGHRPLVSLLKKRQSSSSDPPSGFSH